jgi:hypothetical protein
MTRTVAVYKVPNQSSISLRRQDNGLFQLDWPDGHIGRNLTLAESIAQVADAPGYSPDYWRPARPRPLSRAAKARAKTRA